LPYSLFGPSAWCKVEERQLVVELKAEGELKPGMTITLRQNQQHLVDKLQAKATFKGSVVVEKCLACSRPVARVKGPQVGLPEA
jgi:hypothetical protein